MTHQARATTPVGEPTASPGPNPSETTFRQLRPRVTSLPLPGGVLLRDGDTAALWIATDTPAQTLAQLAALHQGVTLGGDPHELASPLHTLLRQLDDAGWLLHEAIDESDPLALHLAGHSTRPGQLAASIRLKRVELAGDPPLTLAISQALASLGIGSGAIPDDASRPATAADLCIGAWESPELRAMRRLNARAIATRTPTLFLDASHGKHATLGPLVTSDPTACWACWRRRRLEAAPEPRHELAIELAWDHGPEPHANTPGNTAPISPSSPPQPPAARLMPTHRQQLATLVVGEALAWLGQHRAPSCIDAIVTVGLDTPSAQREPLWRIPWCPACSSPPTAPHP